MSMPEDIYSTLKSPSQPCKDFGSPSHFNRREGCVPPKLLHKFKGVKLYPSLKAIKLKKSYKGSSTLRSMQCLSPDKTINSSKEFALVTEVARKCKNQRYGTLVNNIFGIRRRTERKKASNQENPYFEGFGCKTINHSYRS